MTATATGRQTNGSDTNRDQINTRLDHNFNANHKLSFVYTWERGRNMSTTELQALGRDLFYWYPPKPGVHIDADNGRVRRPFRAACGQRPSADAEVHDHAAVRRHCIRRHFQHRLVAGNERSDPTVVVGQFNSKMTRDAH